ncbi:RIP metalloprotease RseP [Spiroplasma taiwanense]|uniref:Zinc metalloprotease n=1 Tax=Spiroplasma taiwanense CT-1 TaxID=1276220 RepID=S5MHR6_9MOLU|nr:RIP metalloprotease RseP [Spiroplasma taiwanense]AGR41425.1 inner membrane zinc metalloprotease [Spiroplasma taiwanense CT-1]
MSSGLIVLAFFIGILVMLILITIHEFGHFIVAKLSNAYVYEFSIGFGPRIFVWKRKETWFSIRVIPLGGYCSIASDKVDPPSEREDEEVPNERKLDYIARWKKMFFILAGPAMNLAIALLLFTSIFAALQVKKNDMSYFGATYDQEKIAAKLILKKEQLDNPEINYIGQEYVIWGWTMKTINPESQEEIVLFDNICNTTEQNQTECLDEKINTEDNNQSANYEKTVYNFLNNLSKANGYENVQIMFSYKKVDKYSGVSNENPKYTEFSDYKSGETIGIAAPNRLYRSVGEAYGAGWKETFKDSISILQALGMVFTGQFDQLAGPVGVARQTATLLGSADQFFLYVAMISANLFILNLIFIPPLDGYRLLENFIEMIIKKELPYKYKIIVNSVGAILFLLLFIIITIKDFII